MPKQSSLFSDDQYNDFLTKLKQNIKSAQIKAALKVNQELIHLYWIIGREILERQNKQGWGSKVIDRLAKDLKKEFPDMTGLSRSNLKNMRAFAQAWPSWEISQQLVGQIPWGHNVLLLQKLKDTKIRTWYAQKTAENSWSRNVLSLQIEHDLYQRQGGAITNFERTLPEQQSDLAQSLLKSEYNLEFLGLKEKAQERDLENALVEHIKDFLLELGVGFAFMGSQYPIEVSGKEFRLDLLFYHTQLRCYIIIDLKMGEFEPEYSGKMNFYVAAVDDLLRHGDDQPTIGIVLCKSKDKTIAEYALRNVNTPIAVSTHKLPQKLQDSLPSIEQLEMEMDTAFTTIESETEP